MLLNESGAQQIADKTLDMLAKVGLKIENDELIERMKKAGCDQASDGRVLIPPSLIDDLVAHQKKNQARDAEDQELLSRFGPDYAHHLIWTGQRDSIRKEANERMIMQAFDCGPTKYFDYPSDSLKAVNADIFEQMMKFAEATPEIGYTSTWYRQDLPPYIERLDSLVNGLKYTTKLDGIEAIFPEVIKYLIEAGEIYYEKPGCDWFLAGSECLTSPLILEERSAADMVERARVGVRRYHIATMPTIGVSTPVFPAAATILMCAEILGGMAVAYVLDPEADISGRAICTVLDMRTAAASSLGPEIHLANLATKEVFDLLWGGTCWVEVHFAAGARRPGLEAALEYFIGSARFAMLTGKIDMLYTGMGTLELGGVGSPTQFMLDLEIRRMLEHCRGPMTVSDETLCYDLLCEHVRSGEEFLSSEHTLDNYHALFTSDLFASTFSGTLGIQHGTEKQILDKADQMWRDNLAKWQPPQVSDQKMKDLEAMLRRARKEFKLD
jgi:trimethylamine:corrinoid methyltransferase-like protein